MLGGVSMSQSLSPLKRSSKRYGYEVQVTYDSRIEDKFSLNKRFEFIGDYLMPRVQIIRDHTNVHVCQENLEVQKEIQMFKLQSKTIFINSFITKRILKCPIIYQSPFITRVQPITKLQQKNKPKTCSEFSKPRSCFYNA